MLAGKDLEAALRGEPWAVSGLVHGVERLLDDEGRPVAERRAPSSVKEGVPMELKPCPYRDERGGSPMNISTLAQVTRHLDDVLSDVHAIRAGLPPTHQGWGAFLEVVLDQLAGPSLHLLRLGRHDALVPARVAVGHKLAAGYFGVLRQLLVREACGERREPTVEGFLAFVHQTRSLIGASEVCSGPPHLLARCTESMLHGGEPRARAVAPERVVIASTLAAQVRVGIAWELFDAQLERRLLLDDLGPERLRPRNAFMQRALDTRLAEILGEPGGEAVGGAAGLPPGLDCPEVDALGALLADDADPPALVREIVLALVSHQEGGIALGGGADAAVFAGRFARYLAVYRATVLAQWSLERRARAALDATGEAPMRVNQLMLPKGQSLRWFEAILGHRVDAEPAAPWALALRNHRRTKAVPPG
jgi:hypothetical protein